jgi:hypothetical protein
MKIRSDINTQIQNIEQTSGAATIGEGGTPSQYISDIPEHIIAESKEISREVTPPATFLSRPRGTTRW